uniref:Glycosyltransferase n=1 Tax=viral metagenome TaxID=1070528 RepID=A0A6C0KF32_9ZZZZ
MKNILIIAKMNLFKEQPSNNRVDLLNFLSTKSNIKIMNDKEGQTLKGWISKTKKRIKWEPDVIIYYFLSRQEKWTEISIKDFNKNHINLPRYMIFEDSHYYETAIPLYKKYKFELLLKPQKKKLLDEQYNNAGVNIDYWGYFIDSNKFKMRELKNGFKYDILLYGFLNKMAYPLRVKCFEVLQFLNQRTNLRIKHIPHPGYYNGALNKMPKNEELSKIINESRFTLVSSSYFQILLKKYMEVPMSGSTMIGDIPPDYPELKDKMIEINHNADHDTIVQTIKKCFENEYIEVEKESRKYGLLLSRTKNFECGYNLLNKITEQNY